MDLFSYYKKGALLPLFLSILAGIALSISQGRLEGEGFMKIVTQIIILSLILTILSSTLFLNSIQLVAKRRSYSLAAWTLLPIGFIAYILVSEIIEWTLFPGVGNVKLELYIIFVCLIHCLALVVSYIRFRRVMGIR